MRVCVYVHTHGSFMRGHNVSGSLSFTDIKIDQ